MTQKTFPRVNGPGRHQKSPESTRRRAIHRNRRLRGTDLRHHRRKEPATPMKIAPSPDHGMVLQCRSLGNSLDIEGNHLPMPRAVDVNGHPDQPGPTEQPLHRRPAGTTSRASAPAS
jgi:hypothetical protein